MSPREVEIRGPLRATPADIEDINRVFADAFTERYHRDGMTAVRVPQLNQAVWRYALAVAGDGALLWRDGRDAIAAFNLAHTSGAEGWMGPLAVRPDWQGRGVGRSVVRAGIEHLRRRQCRVIGLETMPRTIDNIGFYSGLGFLPGHLTISMVRDLRAGDRTSPTAHVGRNAIQVEDCQALTETLVPGLDFSREVGCTRALALGDVTGLPTDGRLAAFALWHSAPLAVGRSPEELRVLKIVAEGLEPFRLLMEMVVADAAALGLRRVTVRCQTAYRQAYAVLLAAGFRVHWTDLRMSLAGFEEHHPERGIVFSNWEI